MTSRNVSEIKAPSGKEKKVGSGVREIAFTIVPLATASAKKKIKYPKENQKSH